MDEGLQTGFAGRGWVTIADHFGDVGSGGDEVAAVERAWTGGVCALAAAGR